jgi:hypothetical protein
MLAISPTLYSLSISSKSSSSLSARSTVFSTQTLRNRTRSTRPVDNTTPCPSYSCGRRRPHCCRSPSTRSPNKLDSCNFPGAEHWACAAASPDAPPSPPYTSCLCQPPVHAVAALKIWEASGDGKARAEASAFLRQVYPKLFAWHRYLATAHDTEGSGLVTIYHPGRAGPTTRPGGTTPWRRLRWVISHLTHVAIFDTLAIPPRDRRTRIATATCGW